MSANKPLEINTSNARSAIDLIRHIITKNQWKEVSGSRGDLIWYGLAITDDEISLSPKKLVNRFPGMDYISQKRTLGEFIKLINKYYPKQFDICPRTYLLPDDYSILESKMSKKKKYFIVKPTSGSQGEGIYMISSARDLENTRIHNWSEVVVQEYLHPPLLLNKKKFDLRLYVLITSLNPLCAYLNTEGLARFCTEDYCAPTNQNISNSFMHLTNYSLNKRSKNFVHTDELLLPNDGSKQTLTSMYAELEAAGYPIDVIKANIKQLIAKTLVAIHVGLLHQYESRLKINKVKKIKCFHITGIDVMITEDCKPWLLEINANPSLLVDFESESAPGVFQSFPSPLDLYIKTLAVEDAIKISRIKLREQLNMNSFGSYERVLPGEYDFSECSTTMIELRDAFVKLTEIKSPLFISSGRFRRIFNKIRGRLQKEVIQPDLDIIYLRNIRKFDLSQMDYFCFISAIEEIANRYMNGELINRVKHLISLMNS